ncbi:hypothetical protein SERV_ORF30 [short-finned eel virus]|uniref:Uncharacterized protein n=1 Tax=short-finned eel virus TaxID=2848076 RepID=A0A192GQC2_FRG3V|nr:hypothetical protein SERV_ORF30 [Short-finned eel ranavirus]ANK58118.1 hypothetical protein SERV_ORF30 [Short-finned eel ranavirus]
MGRKKMRGVDETGRWVKTSLVPKMSIGETFAVSAHPEGGALFGTISPSMWNQDFKPWIRKTAVDGHLLIVSGSESELGAWRELGARGLSYDEFTFLCPGDRMVWLSEPTEEWLARKRAPMWRCQAVWIQTEKCRLGKNADTTLGRAAPHTDAEHLVGMMEDIRELNVHEPQTMVIVSKTGHKDYFSAAGLVTVSFVDLAIRPARWVKDRVFAVVRRDDWESDRFRDLCYKWGIQM